MDLQDIKSLGDVLSLKLLEEALLSTQESSVEASLGGLVQKPAYARFKKIKVKGKARKVPAAQGSPLGQIVWTRVAVKEKGKLRTRLLQKPLTSSFKVSGSRLKAGSILKAQGDVHALIMDAQKLLKGEDGEILIQVESPQTAFSNDRRVDGSSFQGRVGGGAKSQSVLDENLGQAAVGSTVPGNPPSQSEGLGLHSETSRKPRESRIAEAQAPSRRTASPHPGDRAFSNFGAGACNNRRSSPAQAASSSPAVQSAQAGLNGAALTAGGSVRAARGDGRRDGFTERERPAAEPVTAPVTEVRLTREGCTPRVDLAQGRVVIRSRTQTFEDGEMVREDPCADTLETYPIKKDYLCEDCTDLVDFDGRAAYARFRYYWTDGAGERREISSHLETDDTRPFPFMEDPALCAPDFDFDRNLAYRQAETAYFNRNNGRIKTAECHRLEGVEPSPLTSTRQGCKPVHDFSANTSQERARIVFALDGAVHEARGCRDAGEPIAHEFVTSVCTPLCDQGRGLITPMARRRIQTSQGPKFITQECEPYGQSQALQSTVQGCEGEYFHDFDAGKSYLKKRYYHTLGGSPVYLTGCLRSDEFLPHQVEVKGYRHDDAAKVSRPETAVSVVPSPGRRIEISHPQVRADARPTPYVFVRKIEKMSVRNPTYQGCHRLTPTDQVEIYRRADGSSCEIIVGEGAPLRGPDECRREPETAEAYVYRVDYRSLRFNGVANYYYATDRSVIYSNNDVPSSASSSPSPHHIFRKKVRRERAKVTTPSGQVSYTEWRETGLIEDWVKTYGYT